MRRRLFIGICVSICLVGCSSRAVPSEPSALAVTTVLPAVRTARSTWTVTLTSKPTITVSPEAVPSAEITETPAAAPDFAGMITANHEPRLAESLLSPDGRWRAEVRIYDCTLVGSGDELAFEQLHLIRVADGVMQIAASQLQSCGGLGAFGLEGLFWSPNSRFFYYTDAREGVPDGCGFWERPMIRLDVMNLDLTYLGGGPRSPDETMLATWQGQELVVWDSDAGEMARIPAAVSDALVGPIAWSPDSQSLVYSQVASDCPLSGKSYIVLLALPEFIPSVLLESEAPSFGNIIWDMPDELRLFDENAGEWLYNFATQELKQAP